MQSVSQGALLKNMLFIYPGDELRFIFSQKIMLKAIG